VLEAVGQAIEQGVMDYLPEWVGDGRGTSRSFEMWGDNPKGGLSPIGIPTPLAHAESNIMAQWRVTERLKEE